MLNTDIPKVIYDNQGNELKVAKYSKIFFKNRNEYGYVFHVEKAEKITTVSEFEIKYKNGKYFIDRDIFLEVTVVL